MDRKTQSLQATLELLRKLFDMPAPREEKCKTLFELAQKAKGPIVELGTYHGNGYIALYFGSDGKNKVYTIDDYSPKEGWAGEKYGPEDRKIFRTNMLLAGVKPIHIPASCETAATLWKHMPEIGLLFWDLGQANVSKTMPLWEPYIKKHGMIAIHDTYSDLFGAVDYIGKLCQDGYYKDYKVMAGGVHVAVRK